ncbi:MULTISPECIES: helix-turn-helix transcriptional regulator [unclassified Nocardiopsis]|uniref:helix-turn-helix domain-containing protein n=1 Tax=unclassified Nocardiopsis TaxID=2649073 RepID=UPI00066E555D|nr:MULTISPECIES: helix-turn-helix transcriptional regulator [unclassified Nocardiopsis]MBQ1082114.1 helix-turn-helix domain-containing protein [Nocardiopsis sp. B62]PWV45687.1 helix-turn-helix protein [Nocardiopsis sp. L17-MgMaSL7]
MAASPTLRRKRLSRQLNALRAESGLTVDAVAKKAKALRPDRPWSAAKLTRLETQQWKRLHTDDLLALLDVYSVTDKAERASYVRTATEASQTGWWVNYSDILGSGAYVDLETEASRIRTYEAFYIPGLLQTEEYARSVISAGVTDTRQIERRVEARMVRQALLSPDAGPKLWAILDEAAFHRIPAAVLPSQVEHLLEVQKPDARVQIQILPYSSGPHAAMTGQFVILDFPADPSTVYLEQSVSGLFPEDPVVLDHYEMLYDRVHAQALSVEASRDFLKNLIE